MKRLVEAATGYRESCRVEEQVKGQECWGATSQPASMFSSTGRGLQGGLTLLRDKY